MNIRAIAVIVSVIIISKKHLYIYSSSPVDRDALQNNEIQIQIL